MEQSSVQEPRSPEAFRPTHVRPPGLEFALGMALFAATLLVFFLVQSGVFMAGVLERSPDLAPDGFHLGLLGDSAFNARMQEYTTNGDVLAPAAVWSGLAGMAFIMLAVFRWKRRLMVDFLGLRIPAWGPMLRWVGVFALLAAAIEVLARMSPAFHTDFMEQVLASTTERWVLVLGVGIMAPLFEEFLLRGLLYGSLRHLMEEHSAVAVTAGVFALMHLQYEWTIMLLIVPMGVVLGYARSRGGSIWVAVLLHMANNLVSVFVA